MTEISWEDIQNRIAEGKRYTLIFLKTGPKRNHSEDEAERIQKEHLKYLFTLKDQGRLLINGPVEGHREIKGMSIYNTPDQSEAIGWASKDPAVKAGRLVVEAFPWFGIPGSSLV